MQQISAHIAVELHKRLKSHPLREGKTLSEFIEYGLEKFLDSAEARLAETSRDLENEQFEKQCWKQRAEQLEAENRDLKSGEPAPAAPVAAAPAASPAPAMPPDEPEGDFVAVIQSAAPDESPSRSAVDFTLAGADGSTFVDRLVDFPPSPRAAYFKRAVGTGVGDSIVKNAASIIGKSVLVRRTKNPDTSGPRMLTYYHPVPASVVH